MPGPSPGVEVALRTDPGRDPDKQVNEDACGDRATPFGHLVVVCDGMGGHEGGREASSAALESILRTFEIATPGTDPREVLRLAVARANDVVFELGIGKEAGARPGSTVVAILVHDGGTEVAHVGDSRCYRVHQGQIAQITKDHSVVQKLVDAGALTPAQAAHHPDANRITRALGSKLGVEVELAGAPLGHVAGDTFVLCSDGLSDLVEPEDILRIVTSAPPEQAAGQLVDLANARGGHDNITVAVCRPRETAKASTSLAAGATASSPRVAPTIPATIAESGPALPAPPPTGEPREDSAERPAAAFPQAAARRAHRRGSGAGRRRGRRIRRLAARGGGGAPPPPRRPRGVQDRPRAGDDDAGGVGRPAPAASAGRRRRRGAAAPTGRARCRPSETPPPPSGVRAGVTCCTLGAP